MCHTNGGWMEGFAPQSCAAEHEDVEGVVISQSVLPFSTSFFLFGRWHRRPPSISLSECVFVCVDVHVWVFYFDLQEKSHWFYSLILFTDSVHWFYSLCTAFVVLNVLSESGCAHARRPVCMLRICRPLQDSHMLTSHSAVIVRTPVCL